MIVRLRVGCEGEFVSYGIHVGGKMGDPCESCSRKDGWTMRYVIDGGLMSINSCDRGGC